MLHQTDFYLVQLKIINKIPTNETVFIAPLDWGLGHATRCVPIILTLLKQQNKVFVCASGAVKKLLEADCPDAHFISFPGYNIHYNKRFGSVIFSLFWQLPKMAYKAIEEYYLLKKLVKSIRPSLIISDNRLGFRHKEIRSVYITHQLGTETGHTFLNSLAQRCHYAYLEAFDECWVPDQKGDESLAGKLSQPRKMPRIPVHYIGWLSRFTPVSVEKNTRP